MKTKSISTVAFHGTTAGLFDAFKSHIRKGEQLGFGTHFSSDPLFAKLYALDPTVARKGKHPTLYCAKVHLRNPLKANQIVREGSHEFDIAKRLAGRKLITSKDEEGIPCAWLQTAVDAATPVKAQALLSELGYDGLIYDSIVGSRGVNARITAKSTSYIAFSPEQIKIISVIDFKTYPLVGSTSKEHDEELLNRIKNILRTDKAFSALDKLENKEKRLAPKLT